MRKRKRLWQLCPGWKDGQTHVVTPWAPVGAKKSFNLSHQTHLFCFEPKMSFCGWQCCRQIALRGLVDEPGIYHKMTDNRAFDPYLIPTIRATTNPPFANLWSHSGLQSNSPHPKLNEITHILDLRISILPLPLYLPNCAMFNSKAGKIFSST